jgi:YidC/Oxa1 family membrane protein insertase
MSLLNPYLWIKLVLNEIIYRPIFNLLLILVALTGGSLGWAIILLTIIVRLILLKPGLAGNDVQKHMTDLQPKLKEIQEKHKDNPQKMTEEMMKVMKQ